MTVPQGLSQMAALVRPGVRAAIERIEDRQMRVVAGYQVGCYEADGTPAADEHGGKGIRGALALLATEATGADGLAALPAAVAVELVHNFSLLHDDVMDRDVERRHRPTGWIVFGENAAILAGTAMLTLAAQLLHDRPAAQACLLDATQRLISGQSDDLRLERADEVRIGDVLRMEAGKTAALLSCAAAIGPCAVGAPQPMIDALGRYGFELGLAFQLVDDVLGIVGDPARTGKSASSDIRAGKRSAPIVAALEADGDAAARLRELLAAGPPSEDDDVALAAKLVDEAGGIDWARTEAAARVEQATAALADVGLLPAITTDLVALGRYVLDRDH